MPLRRHHCRPRIAEAAAQLPLLEPSRGCRRATRQANVTGQLCVAQVDGTSRPATEEEILAAARTILARRVRRGRPLTSPRHTREYLRQELATLEHEVFAILFLDNRHRVIEFVPLFRGTVDGASVHPREVVKEALARNAAAVILAHNHPSGIAEPSQADELITQRVKDALALIDVRVLDHLVVTGDAIVSFAERGLL
jgi:DNA repair protein RadC